MAEFEIGAPVWARSGITWVAAVVVNRHQRSYLVALGGATGGQRNSDRATL